MATMISSARMSVGTNSGPVEVSTAPDGHGTRTKSETVNADGSTTVTTTGSGNTGVAVDTMAEGRAIYSVDGAGNFQATQAIVNGLNPVTVGAMAQHQKIVSASNSLGSSKNWNSVWDQIQKDSLTSSEARLFSNRLDNALRANWKRAFSDKSSFVHSLDEVTRTTFQASIGGGFKKIFGANGQITVLGNNGEKVSFNVSESTDKAFARDQARVQSEALSQAMQNSQGLDYMTKLAKQIGASEAYSFLNDARELKTSTESYGADLTTALVKNYAMERYGSESPENIRHTIQDFNHYLTQQGSQGVDNMHEIINGFVSGKGYGWGDTTHQVHDAMQKTKIQIDGQDILKSAADQTSVTAAGNTSDITSEKLSFPDNSNQLREPDGTRIQQDADTLHNLNRREEAGKGRIQTTASGITKEGVGKTFKGLVDSQGMRPTDDKGYFDTFTGVNAPKPTVMDGVTLPDPGPVPKDAPSTLGKKK
jgi:conjugal transfer mating pair stabilization protein TraG